MSHAIWYNSIECWDDKSDFRKWVGWLVNRSHDILLDGNCAYIMTFCENAAGVVFAETMLEVKPEFWAPPSFKTYTTLWTGRNHFAYFHIDVANFCPHFDLYHNAMNCNCRTYTIWTNVYGHRTITPTGTDDIVFKYIYFKMELVTLLQL